MTTLNNYLLIIRIQRKVTRLETQEILKKKLQEIFVYLLKCTGMKYKTLRKSLRNQLKYLMCPNDLLSNNCH